MCVYMESAGSNKFARVFWGDALFFFFFFVVIFAVGVPITGRAQDTGFVPPGESIEIESNEKSDDTASQGDSGTESTAEGCTTSKINEMKQRLANNPNDGAASSFLNECQAKQGTITWTDPDGNTHVCGKTSGVVELCTVEDLFEANQATFQGNTIISENGLSRAAKEGELGGDIANYDELYKAFDDPVANQTKIPGNEVPGTDPSRELQGIAARGSDAQGAEGNFDFEDPFDPSTLRQQDLDTIARLRQLRGAGTGLSNLFGSPMGGGLFDFGSSPFSSPVPNSFQSFQSPQTFSPSQTFTPSDTGFVPSSGFQGASPISNTTGLGSGPASLTGGVQGPAFETFNAAPIDYQSVGPLGFAEPGAPFTTQDSLGIGVDGSGNLVFLDSSGNVVSSDVVAGGLQGPLGTSVNSFNPVGLQGTLSSDFGAQLSDIANLDGTVVSPAGQDLSDFAPARFVTNEAQLQEIASDYRLQPDAISRAQEALLFGDVEGANQIIGEAIQAGEGEGLLSGFANTFRNGIEQIGDVARGAFESGVEGAKRLGEALGLVEPDPTEGTLTAEDVGFGGDDDFSFGDADTADVGGLQDVVSGDNVISPDSVGGLEEGLSSGGDILGNDISSDFQDVAGGSLDDPSSVQFEDSEFGDVGNNLDSLSSDVPVAFEQSDVFADLPDDPSIFEETLDGVGDALTSIGDAIITPAQAGYCNGCLDPHEFRQVSRRAIELFKEKGFTDADFANVLNDPKAHVALQHSTMQALAEVGRLHPVLDPNNPQVLTAAEWGKAISESTAPSLTKTSGAGARGFYQVMPGTARDLGNPEAVSHDGRNAIAGVLSLNENLHIASRQNPSGSESQLLQSAYSKYLFGQNSGRQVSSYGAKSLRQAAGVDALISKARAGGIVTDTDIRNLSPTQIGYDRTAIAEWKSYINGAAEYYSSPETATQIAATQVNQPSSVASISSPSVPLPTANPIRSGSLSFDDRPYSPIISSGVGVGNELSGNPYLYGAGSDVSVSAFGGRGRTVAYDSIGDAGIIGYSPAESPLRAFGGEGNVIGVGNESYGNPYSYGAGTDYLDEFQYGYEPPAGSFGVGNELNISNDPYLYGGGSDAGLDAFGGAGETIIPIENRYGIGSDDGLNYGDYINFSNNPAGGDPFDESDNLTFGDRAQSLLESWFGGATPEDATINAGEGVAGDVPEFVDEGFADLDPNAGIPDSVVGRINPPPLPTRNPSTQVDDSDFDSGSGLIEGVSEPAADFSDPSDQAGSDFDSGSGLVQGISDPASSRVIDPSDRSGLDFDEGAITENTDITTPSTGGGALDISDNPAGGDPFDENDNPTLTERFGNWWRDNFGGVEESFTGELGDLPETTGATPEQIDQNTNTQLQDAFSAGDIGDELDIPETIGADAQGSGATGDFGSDISSDALGEQSVAETEGVQGQSFTERLRSLFTRSDNAEESFTAGDVGDELDIPESVGSRTIPQIGEDVGITRAPNENVISDDDALGEQSFVSDGVPSRSSQETSGTQDTSTETKDTVFYQPDAENPNISKSPAISADALPPATRAYLNNQLSAFGGIGDADGDGKEEFVVSAENYNAAASRISSSGTAPDTVDILKQVQADLINEQRAYDAIRTNPKNNLSDTQKTVSLGSDGVYRVLDDGGAIEEYTAREVSSSEAKLREQVAQLVDEGVLPAGSEIEMDENSQVTVVTPSGEKYGYEIEQGEVGSDVGSDEYFDRALRNTFENDAEYEQAKKIFFERFKDAPERFKQPLLTMLRKMGEAGSPPPGDNQPIMLVDASGARKGTAIMSITQESGIVKIDGVNPEMSVGLASKGPINWEEDFIGSNRQTVGAVSELTGAERRGDNPEWGPGAIYTRDLGTKNLDPRATWIHGGDGSTLGCVSVSRVCSVAHQAMMDQVNGIPTSGEPGLEFQNRNGVQSERIINGGYAYSFANQIESSVGTTDNTTIAGAPNQGVLVSQADSSNAISLPTSNARGYTEVINPANNSVVGSFRPVTTSDIPTPRIESQSGSIVTYGPKQETPAPSPRFPGGSTPTPSFRDIVAGAQDLFGKLAGALGGGGSGGGGATPQQTAQNTQSPTPPEQSMTPRLACADDVAIIDGQGTTTVRWACTNGSTSRGIGFETNGSASGQVTFNVTGSSAESSFEAGIECIRNGEVTNRTCDIPIVRPVVNVVANPSSVDTGDTAQIIWSSVGTIKSTNACLVFSSEGAITRGGQTGTVETLALTRNTEFGVACQTSSGTSVVNKIVVRVSGDAEAPEPAVLDENSSDQEVASFIEDARESASLDFNDGQTAGQNEPPSETFLGTDAEGNQVQLCNPEIGITKFTWCLLKNR